MFCVESLIKQLLLNDQKWLVLRLFENGCHVMANEEKPRTLKTAVKKKKIYEEELNGDGTKVGKLIGLWR